MESSRKKSKNIIIRTGTVEDFIARAKDIMRTADRKEPIQPSHTLIFENSAEMQCFISKKKTKK